MAIKTSLCNQCKSNPISALERNLNAKANSTKPKTTLTVFNQPPDFGIFPNNVGAKAKNINGKAKPNPNPSMAIESIVAPPSEFNEVPKTSPKAGPMHENETIINVSAMKNIPINPPLLEALSTLLENLDGSVISKAPKNDIANTVKIKKKNRLT